MNNELSTINNLPRTKEDIMLMAEKAVNAIEDGTVHPMEFFQALKAIEKFHETIKPVLDKAVLSEASKYPEKLIEFGGAKFRIGEFGTSYDFTGCNDPEWVKLKAEETAAKEALKAREELLKTLKEPMEAYDSETAEVYMIHPPVKKSTTGVQVSFT